MFLLVFLGILPRFTKVYSDDSFLRFVPSGLAKDQQELKAFEDTVIHLDAAFAKQTVLQIVAQISPAPKFKLHCKVAKLAKSAKLTQKEICVKKSDNMPPICVTASLNRDRKYYAEDIDILTGFVLVSNYEPSAYRYRKAEIESGFVFCRLGNKNGVISSNFIKIQDIFFWRIQITNAIHVDFYPPLKTITKNDLPLLLNCGKFTKQIDVPEWVKTSLVPIISWNWCPPAYTTAFQCSAFGHNPIYIGTSKFVRNLDRGIEYNILWNGSLIIYSFGKTFDQDLALSTLLCMDQHFKRRYLAFYSSKDLKPLVYNNDVPYTRRCEPIGKTNFKIEVMRGSKRRKFKLAANYRCNPDTIYTQWTKDGKKFFGAGFRKMSHVLEFPPVIELEHAGRYQLSVRSQGYSFTFSFNVIIPTIPIFIGKLPPAISYKMIGEDFTLEANFSGATKKYVIINGQQIEYESDAALAASLEELSQRYQYLGILDATIFPQYSDFSIPLQYKVKNLQKLDGYPQSQSHSVSIVASNSFGTSRVSTFVRVLEKPIVDPPLLKFNCTRDCFNSEEHLFRCNIKNLKVLTDNQVNVTWRWYLINEKSDVPLFLNTLSSAFIHKKYFSWSGNTLKLLKIDTKEMVENVQNAIIRCRILIYRPDTDSKMINVGSVPKSYILYDSDEDNQIQAHLDAVVRLTIDPFRGLKSASFSWVAAVIVALIVALLTGLFIFCFCMKNRGQSYDVDAKERAKGNDPIKEMRDNETFQPYQRCGTLSDNDHHASQVSLCDNSIEIGSDSGELEDYEMDPSKFNEEGSFIGQYTTNSTNRKKLPTSNQPNNINT